MKDKKAIVWQIWLLNCTIQNGSNKVAFQLRAVQFWSGIMLVMSLKSRVWFHTKLHSTQFNYQYKSLSDWKRSEFFSTRAWLQLRIRRMLLAGTRVSKVLRMSRPLFAGYMADSRSMKVNKRLHGMINTIISPGHSLSFAQLWLHSCWLS